MLDNKKFRISVEVFHEILQICPRLHKHSLLNHLLMKKLSHSSKKLVTKEIWNLLLSCLLITCINHGEPSLLSSNKYGKITFRLKQIIQCCKTYNHGYPSALQWYEDSQVSGKLIPDVMVNDAIKDSTTYQTYCSYSTGVAIPKKARKGTKAANVPKKKDSLIFNDNIITDNPDVALELGKSISKSEAEEQEEARRVHETHKCLAISVIIKDTPSVSKKQNPESSMKLKGIEMLSDATLT
ncbi:hypothetical protein Tco_1576743 [Tanacetum coccineum]